MIVSKLESVALRLLLGAALDCTRRGVYAQVKPYVDELFVWIRQPGVTAAAQVEIDEGQAVRRL